MPPHRQLYNLITLTICSLLFLTTVAIQISDTLESCHHAIWKGFQVFSIGGVANIFS